MTAPRLVFDYPITRESIVQNSITLTDTTETTLIAAATGMYHDLTLLMISNTSASKIRVDFRDTDSGSVIFSVEVAADGGGNNPPFKVPVLQTTANTNWRATLSGSVTDIRIFAQAIKHVA